MRILTEMLATNLLLIAAALLGPVIGGWFHHRYQWASLAATLLMGLIFGYFIVGWSLWVLAVCFIIWTGEMPGVGHPKGYAIDGRDPCINTDLLNDCLEWWQPEGIRHHPFWSLCLRGAMFGAYAFIFSFWQPMFMLLIPAFAIGLPAGMWLALLAREYQTGVNAWRLSEAFQYPCAGVVLLILIEAMK